MANKRYQRMAPYRRKGGAITARHIAIGKSRFKIIPTWKLCDVLILHNFQIEIILNLDFPIAMCLAVIAPSFLL